jgi:hypothetical protein
MPRKIFVVDTNFFLQCHKPEAIHWADVAGLDDVLVVIPRAVQRQIDNFKQSGKDRASKKARETNSFFKKILNAPKRILVQEPGNQRIEFSLLPNPEVAPLAVPIDLVGMDPNDPDDQIVRDAYMLAKIHPNVIVLSHDTGPLATAANYGVASLDIPDSWLLLSEKDAKDKKISELENENQKLRVRDPKIKVTIHPKIGFTDDTISIPVFRRLSPAQIETHMKTALEKRPIDTGSWKTNPSENQSGRLGVLGEAFPALYRITGTVEPSDEDIKRYERNYESWKNKLRSWLENAHQTLSFSAQFPAIECEIENFGTGSALNAIAKFRVTNGVKFSALEVPMISDKDENVSHRKFHESSMPPPVAPKPPSRQPHPMMAAARHLAEDQERRDFFSLLGTTPNTMSIGGRPKDKDKATFYLRGDSEEEVAVETREFTCDSFQHGQAAQSFWFELMVPSEKASIDFKVLVTVSSDSLPEPHREFRQFTIELKEADTDEAVRRLLNQGRFLYL